VAAPLMLLHDVMPTLNSITVAMLVYFVLGFCEAQSRYVSLVS
jgi:hypothetical protein